MDERDLEIMAWSIGRRIPYACKNTLSLSLKNLTERIGYVNKGSAENPSHSTPLKSGSSVDDNAAARRLPMASDLAYRSYTSSTLWHFLKDIPNVVTPEHISDLHKKDEWKQFMNSCTCGENSDPFSEPSAPKPSGSNEKEFRELVQCIVKLEGLGEYFGETQETTEEEPEIDNPRWGRVRISHQGNQPMRTWNAEAKWLNGIAGAQRGGKN
jgi:hypothetical protein